MNERKMAQAIDTYQRIGNSRVQDTGPYSELARVLNAAYDQAAKGKGAERHATDKRFEDQPIMAIQELVGPGFALGQAIKKIQESQRMDAQAAQRELLGAINYLAAAYLQRGKAVPHTPGEAEEVIRKSLNRRVGDSVPVSAEENEDIVRPGDNC